MPLREQSQKSVHFYIHPNHFSQLVKVYSFQYNFCDYMSVYCGYYASYRDYKTAKIMYFETIVRMRLILIEAHNNTKHITIACCSLLSFTIFTKVHTFATKWTISAKFNNYQICWIQFKTLHRIELLNSKPTESLFS